MRTLKTATNWKAAATYFNISIQRAVQIKKEKYPS